MSEHTSKNRPATPTVDDLLFVAAKTGDVGALTALLDQHPDKLYVRDQPYEHTLLHLAAFAGHLATVDLLLRRGLDVNTREKGDKQPRLTRTCRNALDQPPLKAPNTPGSAPTTHVIAAAIAACCLGILPTT